MKKSILSLLALALLTATACKKDTTPGPAANNPNPSDSEMTPPNPDAPPTGTRYNWGQYPQETGPQTELSAQAFYFKPLPGIWPLIDYRIIYLNPDSSFKRETPSDFTHPQGLDVRPYPGGRASDGYDGLLDFRFSPHAQGYWNNIRYTLRLNRGQGYILMGTSHRPFKVVNLDSTNLKTQWWVFDSLKNEYIVYQHTFRR